MPVQESGGALTQNQCPAMLEGEGRFHALDSLRAAAMLLGIVLHGALSFTVLLPVPWAARDVSGHWIFDLAVGLIHGFRMQLFFFIAGFFGRLLYQRLSPAEFLKHRLKRIGVPFAMGMLLLAPVVLVLWSWGVSRMIHPPPMPLSSEGLGNIPTIHLWFLQFLLMLYGAAFCVARLARRFSASVWGKLDDGFDWLLQSPFRALFFVPVTVICLWNGPMWGEAHHAGTTFVPPLNAVAHFGVFFGVGWWLHRRRILLHELSRHLGSGLLIAFGAMALNAMLLGFQQQTSNPNYVWLKLGSLVCAALYAWLMTFAMTGLFLRFAGQPRSWVRYLADASYWCYLAHLPIVIWLQIIFAPWAFPGGVKFTLLMGITMLVLLASYELRVRYTFVGAVLNGPRERPNNRPRVGGRSIGLE
jgi:glucans biosynthesis protein C